MKKKKRLAQITGDYEPQSVAIASTSSTSTRRNRAATDVPIDQYANIKEGMVPYRRSHGMSGACNMNIREAVFLCQKAYYNFAIFRNTIDLMTEFSANQIFLKGGSKKSRNFFAGLWEAINLPALQDKFFREYYRSGNVFLYRLDGEIRQEELDQLSAIYGNELKLSKAKKVKVPIRYVILNPVDIEIGGNISFSNAQYYKVLSDYELQVLKQPKTTDDERFLTALPADVQKRIKNRVSGEVLMPLDSALIYGIFYKKQDYEPFAVPMGFPVLTDINWKSEMKKMDMALTRTVSQCILLVTLGAEPEKGGVNQKHIDALKTFFENESVARVLIADYTTKAQFVVPDIANLLDPKKYAQVDKDIKEGLNNLLINSEDKFANASVKIEVFVERLRQARSAFLTEFLIPEIRRVAEDIGLKNYPVPYFEDIDLKDHLEYSKIYTRLGELGILTPAEVNEAIDNGRLPTKDESVENQTELRDFKDKGLYEPIVGGPFSQKSLQQDSLKSQQKIASMQQEHQQTMTSMQQEHDSKMKTKELRHIAQNPQPAPVLQVQKISKIPGRPSGTKSPQSTKKVKPVGASEGFSLGKIKENISLSDELHKEVEKSVLKKFKVKELSAEQKDAANLLAEMIIANEAPTEWKAKIGQYLINPVDTKPEQIDDIADLAYEHQIDYFMASILYHSRM